MLAQDIHNLYSETVYRFNTIFLPIWTVQKLGEIQIPAKQINEKDVKEEVYFVPIFFSKSIRTFHWVGADVPMWNDNETIRWQLTELIKHLCRWIYEDIYQTNRNESLPLATRLEVWEHFLADLPRRKFSSKGARLICAEVKFFHDAGNKDDWIAKKGESDWEELHRAVLALYSGYHQNARGNVEGVFYSYFEQRKITGDNEYLTGILKYDPGKTEGPFDWLQIDGVSESESLTAKKDDLQRALEALAQDIFLENILLRTNDRRSTPISLGKGVAGRKQVILLPVHDVWVYDPKLKRQKGFGGIKTLLILFFRDKEICNEWLKEKYPLLLARFTEIANYLTASAQVLAASQPIQPPYDLLSHFLKVLPYVQDWESATVFKNGKLQCRYQRIEPTATSFKWGWDKCSENLSVTAPDVHESIETIGESEKYGMWWTADGQGVNLWSADFIPGIEAKEIARFRDLSIFFEFPAATRIPDADMDGGKTRKALRQEYLRQQLDLMRTLIPQVRARRAALRSAVSAIMGRNMSHNIGSHVIARQIGYIKGDLEDAHKDGVDHRESFFVYLQRRMDFLAEIATADKAYWEQPLALDETLGKLDYDKQVTLIKGKEPKVPKGSKPILLSLITGKDNLDASVKLESTDAAKLFFSCPGGEVGAHALYVILENIIRNSARHNGAVDDNRSAKHNAADGNSRLVLKVHVADAKPADNCPDENKREAKGLIALTVVDERTELIAKNTRLVENQNQIFRLEGAGFLNDNNTPNPKNWGLREMQVCANYLRGMALSELESPPSCSFASIEAVAWPEEGSDKKYLAYRFYLQRARILAYVECNDAKVATGVAMPESPAGLERIVMTSDKVNGKNEYDWAALATEARGYSFLWLPEAFKTAFADLDAAQRCNLPQRVIFGSSDELSTLLAQAKSGIEADRLNWTDLLHRKVMDHYRTNKVIDQCQTNGNDKAKLWGGSIRPVDVVFIPDGETEPPSLRTDGIALIWGRFESNFLSPGKASIDTHINNESSPVRLGFLSHADDGKLWGWKDKLKRDKAEDQAELASQQPWSSDVNHSGIRAACMIRYEGDTFSNWAAVEPVWSSSLHQQPFNGGQIDTWRLRELAAAAFARVIVLDERVQAAHAQDVRNVTLWRYWPMAGIWSPFHPDNCDKDNKKKYIDTRQMFHNPELVCNLNEPEFSAIQAFLKAPSLLKRQWPADVLVIHLTILESLNGKAQQDESLPETLRRLVAGTQAEKAAIIVVTGRGVPAVARAQNKDTLPARHLPISTLLEHLTNRPSKLGLMRALWAASSPSNTD